LVISNLHWSFWAALPFAVFVAVAGGVVVAAPAVRLKGHQLLILTFILTEFVVIIGNNWKSLTGGNQGLLVAKAPDSVLGIDFSSPRGFFYLCAGLLLVLLVFYRAVVGSRWGRMFVGVRENEVLARALGINTTLFIVIAFACSGVFAGVGGILFGLHQKQMEPNLFGVSAAVLLPLMVMLGGSRYIWGPTVGAFVVVFLPEVLVLSPAQGEAANGLILILVILLMPNGILGGLNTAVERVQWSHRVRRGPEEKSGVGDLSVEMVEKS
jgi:branched-chain amino acid transport system permease protein